MSSEKYLVDAVALARYVEDRLPAKADAIFRAAERKEVELHLPHVALGEFLYILKKGRLEVQDVQAFERKFLTDLAASIFHLEDMSIDAWKRFIELAIPELHDRMIGALFDPATFKAIITCDGEIQGQGIPCLWE